MKVSRLSIVAWLIVAYVGMTILITALLWAAYSIPREQLYPQIAESNEILQKEGLYPKILFFDGKVRDNYSDACMLNVAFCSQEGDAMDNLRNAMRSTEPIEGSELDGLELAVQLYPTMPECFSYARYWHGYQVYLRPLLTLFNIRQIRIINYILLIGLACLTLITTWHKQGKWYASVLLLAMLSVSFYIVPNCLHFSAIFYIGFISVIGAIYLQNRKYESILRPLLFFVSGALTSCLDLLTAPMIPLVMLLLADTMPRTYTGSMWEQFRKRMTDLVGYGIIWCLGYALFWITKFAVGTLILDSNLFTDALTQTQARMDASYSSVYDWFLKVVLLPIKHNYILALVDAMVLYCFCCWRKYRLHILSNIWLLVVAMIEPTWLFLLRQHTMIHYSIFVWRQEIILVLCLAIFVYRVISQAKQNEKSIH